MPYIPSDLLRCVVFIGYEDQDGHERFAGSGFWVSEGDLNSPRESWPTYLTTAAHVIDQVRNNSPVGSVRVRIRMNEIAGGQKWEETPLELWKTHPDPAVDIAVMKMQLDYARWDHFAWPTEAFVHENSIEDDGGRAIGHGDDLFIAGLFYLHRGEQKNIPILRMANMAALRGERVLNRDGRLMDAYLVESRSIGGLSGSPVFYDVFAAKESHVGEHRFVRKPIRFRLLGVMHGHFEFPDLQPDAIVEDGNASLAINSGIAIVVPSEKIVEVLHLIKADQP